MGCNSCVRDGVDAEVVGRVVDHYAIVGRGDVVVQWWFL